VAVDRPPPPPPPPDPPPDPWRTDTSPRLERQDAHELPERTEQEEDSLDRGAPPTDAQDRLEAEFTDQSAEVDQAEPLIAEATDQARNRPESPVASQGRREGILLGDGPDSRDAQYGQAYPAPGVAQQSDVSVDRTLAQNRAALEEGGGNLRAQDNQEGVRAIDKQLERLDQPADPLREFPPPDAQERLEAHFAQADDGTAVGKSVADVAKSDLATEKPSVADYSAQLEAVEDFGAEPDAAQTALLTREIQTESPASPGPHANEAFRLDFEDGTKAIYKPASGEDGSLRDAIEGGTFWRSEVAAYATDKLLGLDLVPTTAAVNGMSGVGSLQDWVPGQAKPLDGYDPVDRQRMAVLDYVTGNTDRHGGNWLSQIDGRPAAIDNGLSFPSGPADGIKSPWTNAMLDKPLDPGLVASLREVTLDEFADTLRDHGLNDPAIDGAVARLREVQAGVIRGQAWDGKFLDDWWETVKDMRPS
jgi:hypothetical protein